VTRCCDACDALVTRFLHYASHPFWRCKTANVTRVTRYFPKLYKTVEKGIERGKTARRKKTITLENTRHTRHTRHIGYGKQVTE